MSIPQMIGGILLFALATMIIYTWGLKRQVNQSRDLMNLLFSNGEKKIRDYMKKHDSISKEEAMELVSNVTARFPFSSAKATVQNEEDFVENLFAYMEKTGQLTKVKDRYYK